VSSPGVGSIIARLQDVCEDPCQHCLPNFLGTRGSVRLLGGSHLVMINKVYIRHVQCIVN